MNRQGRPAVGSLMVVAATPVYGHAANFVQADEDAAAQDLGAEGLIDVYISDGVHCHAGRSQSSASGLQCLATTTPEAGRQTTPSSRRSRIQSLALNRGYNMRDLNLEPRNATCRD